MQCPNCQSSILLEDRFCETCGVPLSAELSAEISAASPSPPTNCAKCGSSDIDTEGYCVQCGFHNAPIVTNSPADRLELAISPRLAGISDPGLKHHHNEDYVALHSLDDNRHILVVCDGVSSSQTPELAAKAAAIAACQHLVTALQAGIASDLALNGAITAALKDVCAIPYHQREEPDPPSTTIVAAIVEATAIATQISIGWLGDSRAYWMTRETIQQLTEDDSWLNDMVTAGKLSEAEARQSPQAHAINRWLGADVTDDAVPSIVRFTSSSPGYLILCSDGLWNYTAHPQKLAELVQRYTAPEAVVLSRRLVEYARSQGGQDNITVAILSV